jgi:hypothetical protein
MITGGHGWPPADSAQVVALVAMMWAPLLEVALHWSTHMGCVTVEREAEPDSTKPS